jgi:glycosyltransferase involved in cell wall biosynthesis
MTSAQIEPVKRIAPVEASSWPSIAIVTPSLNSSPFLSACLSSVLDQRYPRLQYVVMDGGSSDGSVEVIKARAGQLHYWTSEPDDGPYEAVAKGFAKTDAEIMGWIGADDVLLPWALHIVGGIFRDCPDVEWVTTEAPLEIAADGLPYTSWRVPGFTKRGFRSGENSLGPSAVPLASCIQQESTFWRRTLWEKAGARFATDCKVAGDFELWGRFFDQALLYSIDLPLGAFRRHGTGQKSRAAREQYHKECSAVLARYGSNPPNMKAFLHRRARMVGLQPKQQDGSYEPVHIVRRQAATGRFVTHIV